MKIGLGIGIAIATLAGLLAVGWVGGELHYRNCLTRIDYLYPEASTVETSPYGEAPTFTFAHRGVRRQEIASCSRWPL